MRRDAGPRDLCCWKTGCGPVEKTRERETIRNSKSSANTNQ